MGLVLHPLPTTRRCLCADSALVEPAGIDPALPKLLAKSEGPGRCIKPAGAFFASTVTPGPTLFMAESRRSGSSATGAKGRPDRARSPRYRCPLRNVKRVTTPAIRHQTISQTLLAGIGLSMVGIRSTVLNFATSAAAIAGACGHGDEVGTVSIAGPIAPKTWLAISFILSTITSTAVGLRPVDKTVDRNTEFLSG